MRGSGPMSDGALAKATEAVRKWVWDHICAGCPQYGQEPENCRCVVCGVLDGAPEIAQAVLDAGGYGGLVALVEELAEKTEDTRRRCSSLLGRTDCAKDTCSMWDMCAEADRGERIKAVLKKGGNVSVVADE